MQDAITKSKEKRLNLVSHLVAATWQPRAILRFRLERFGVPLLDLDAITPDADAVRAVAISCYRSTAFYR